MKQRLFAATSLFVVPVALWTICSRAAAQSPSQHEPGDLSGTWVSHPPNKNLTASTPKFTRTIVIHCDKNEIEMQITTNGQQTFQRYIPDGKPHEVAEFWAELEAKTVAARWEGASLVLKYANLIPSIKPEPGWTERWTLSLDGKTLTESRDNVKSYKIVYDKQ